MSNHAGDSATPDQAEKPPEPASALPPPKGEAPRLDRTQNRLGLALALALFAVLGAVVA